jgi:hypothetical protein
MYDLQLMGGDNSWLFIIMKTITTILVWCIKSTHVYITTSLYIFWNSFMHTVGCCIEED